ncbi:MAG: hypothetical protein IKT17_08055 [Lachnospiraceae bacterium]|nr:hypothetical protein [Lachnospiraceae bacterium]
MICVCFVEISGIECDLVYISHADGDLFKSPLIRKYICVALCLRKVYRHRSLKPVKVCIQGFYLINDISVIIAYYAVGAPVDHDIEIVKMDKLLKIHFGIVIRTHSLLDHPVYPGALKHQVYILTAFPAVIDITCAQHKLHKVTYGY